MAWAKYLQPLPAIRRRLGTAMPFIYNAGDQPLRGFTIRRGLGRGGFGEVYEAVSDAGKQVAVKLVQRHLNVELRGVRQCLNLKHPNLVSLYDICQAPNGDHWIIMEYVAGETLDHAIARHPGGMPEAEVLAWFHGMATGVAYLHDQGLVHRDLKPANLFNDGGTVKIGDYGLSKFISASRRSGQTDSIGTVHYVAPEMANGRYGMEVDQYALGIIFYEMLTGRVPFDGQSTGEILMKHLTAAPDVALLPEAYRPIVRRLLEKDPQHRFGSVKDLSAAMPSDSSTSLLRAAELGRNVYESSAASAAQTITFVPPRTTEYVPFNADVMKVLMENGIDSVEDIEHVLRAVAEQPTQYWPALVRAIRILVENGMECGQDVGRIVSALGRDAENAGLLDLPKDLITAVRILLENGMERSQDVERVLDAIGRHSHTDLAVRVKVVQHLIENGIERGQEIARILDAMDPSVNVDWLRGLVDDGMDADQIANALARHGARH